MEVGDESGAVRTCVVLRSSEAARKIYPASDRPCLQPLLVIGAHPDTDLEHAKSASRSESGEIENMRFKLITGAGVRLEFCFLAQVSGAAWLGIPEIGNRVF